MSNVELLAPAGTFEAFVAAVQNGANAVYIGGERFGARAFAANFSDEEIIKAVKYAHIRDVRVYVTVNTLIKDDDFADCMDYIDFLYRNDVDSVILQDVGLASEIHSRYPDFELHASTQMSVSNLQDALFCKSMGFSRVVLARENTAEEVKYIRDHTGLEIESFVHGALCVSYSGKCLFSYVNGGRSGNQGACAQPCRKKYYFESAYHKKSFDHFLSTKDLCTVKDLKHIMENGTYSLKIEGRMKRPEYVATVVKGYRRAIDAILSNQDTDLDSLEQEMMTIFNREFTRGLILNDPPQNIGNSSTPNNIGIALGKVTQVLPKKKRIEISLDIPLNKGDGLSLGEHVGRILLGDRVVESAHAGQRVMLDYLGKARVGDIIRKTSDRSLLENAKQSYGRESVKIPLYAKIILSRANNPEIFVCDDRGNQIIYRELSELVEESLNHEITKDEVYAQMCKTEGTPFYFESLDIRLDKGSFLRKSTLNALRRNALDAIREKRESLYKDRDKNISGGTISRDNGHRKNSAKILSPIQADMLSVKCFSKEQIQACKAIGVGAVYVCDEEIYLFAKEVGVDVFFCTPIMLKDFQIKRLEPFIDAYQPNILTTSIGYAKYIAEKYRESLCDSVVRLDYLSNILNRYSFNMLNNEAIQSATVSLEHPGLINGIIRHHNNAEFPLFIHPIMMVTEFCPYKTETPCTVCRIDEGRLLSEDRETEITIKRDLFCRMQLVGQRPMDFSKGIQNAKNSGINKFRIDLLNQSKKETADIIQRYIGR